jgi:GGDEF domain-containing protein
MSQEAGLFRAVSTNRRDLDQLERRELQLTIVAVVFVLVLAGGLAAFMYPQVFVHPDEHNKWTLRVAYFGFCLLTLLFVIYLFDRQRTVAKLKQQVIEELERNIELRVQACADLLQTMPDIHHFWDRLTMEFRRAMTLQRTLSLLVVKVKPGPRSLDEDNNAAWADAAKAMSRRLRPTDSIYRLARDLFGLVLPQTDTANAGRIASRLQEELGDVSLRHGFAFTTAIRNYPEHVKSAYELEDIVKSLLPEKEESGVPASTPYSIV